MATQHGEILSAASEIGISSDVLENSDKPMVRIVVEGKVGCGKTALVSMIQEMLKGKVRVIIENEYTANELKLNVTSDNEETLKMYSPVILLCERISSTM